MTIKDMLKTVGLSGTKHLFTGGYGTGHASGGSLHHVPLGPGLLYGPAESAHAYPAYGGAAHHVVSYDHVPQHDEHETHHHYHRPKKSGSYSSGKNDAAISALTLLAFLFFLNVLQNLLRDQFNNGNNGNGMGTGTGPFIVTTARRRFSPKDGGDQILPPDNVDLQQQVPQQASLPVRRKTQKITTTQSPPPKSYYYRDYLRPFAAPTNGTNNAKGQSEFYQNDRDEYSL